MCYVCELLAGAPTVGVFNLGNLELVEILASHHQLWREFYATAMHDTILDARLLAREAHWPEDSAVRKKRRQGRGERC